MNRAEVKGTTAIHNNPVRIRESRGYRTFTVFNTIIMILISAVTLYPFLYLAAQSFSSQEAIRDGLVSIWPVGFNIDTYDAVLKKGDFIGYYGNTLLYTAVGTTFSLLLSAMLAYPLSKKSLRLNRFLTPFIVFTMYFGGGMIPNYVLMTRLNLIDNLAAFVIPSLISTYYVLLMKSFFAGVPSELEEAGEMDGLNKFGVFFRIVLPLSMPIMATMLLFYAVGYWNNWFNAFLYIKTKAKWPVAYYLKTIISGTNDATQASESGGSIAANLKSCCMLLMAVPIICVYPFIQKYYVQGMMLGGVKE